MNKMVKPTMYLLLAMNQKYVLKLLYQQSRTYMDFRWKFCFMSVFFSTRHL